MSRPTEKALRAKCADYFAGESRADLAADAETKSTAEGLVMVLEHATAELGTTLQDALSGLHALNELRQR